MSVMLNEFIVKNWFDLLQSVFIVGGFFLSYFAIKSDTRSRKVEHLLQINQSQREIWNKIYSNPELYRIKETDVDLDLQPITLSERRLIQETILHIYAVHQAIKNKQLKGGKMEKEIGDYLRLPIPNKVWQEVEKYYDVQFVKYINDLLSTD